jgi:rhodanese-related sulfurtransferase
MGSITALAKDAGRPGPGRSIAEAGAIVICSVLVALTVNALRPHGLPLVARTPYETLVPCPEPGGPVDAIAATSSEVRSPRSFVIDARPPEEFRAGHLPGAVSVPYDWLDPVPDERLVELARAVAASGATRVVVYGDGGRPDSGEYLGKEISARGIKNVSFIEGGAPAVLEGVSS